MIAIIGSTGFVGRNLVKALSAKNHKIRALVRDELRARSILSVTNNNVDLFVGDMHDKGSIEHLFGGVRAVYVLVQTITTQQPLGPQRFDEAERAGLETIINAARSRGVNRILTLGLIGTSIESECHWPRERAKNERFLLDSGLDATIFRPGLIVGRGGHGFDMLLAAANRRISPIIGSGRQKYSYLALDDVVAYLVDALDESGTMGRAFDVGSTEAPSYRELVVRTSNLLGRKPSILISIPLPVLRMIAPLLELIQHVPRGGLSAAIEYDFEGNLVGDTEPIRNILPRRLLTWDEAVERAISRP